MLVKLLLKLYHFLGGVYFALLLISLTAFMVLLGTLIESQTDSHRLAAHYIYTSSLFALLLAGFFINILFAATRRWPFKYRHFPFLITHLGLLLLLSGALVKNFFGVQGYLLVSEGTGSHTLFLPDTEGLLLEQKKETSTADSSYTLYPIRHVFFGAQDTILSSDREKTITLKHYYPALYPTLDMWIKGDKVHIKGLTPFDLNLADAKQTYLLAGKKWQIKALRTTDPLKALYEAFIEETTLKITDALTAQLLYQAPLSQALLASPTWLNSRAQLALHTPSLTENFKPRLEAEIFSLFSPTEAQFSLSIPLTGPYALLNFSPFRPFVTQPTVSLDLVRIPTLLIIQNQQAELLLATLDEQGRIHLDFSTSLSSLPYFLRDGEYFVKADLSASSADLTRDNLEKELLEQLREFLTDSLTKKVPLSPPLACLYQACQLAKVDFIPCCLELLIQWHHSQSWLLPTLSFSAPLTKALAHLNLQQPELPCQWAAYLFDELNSSLIKGEDLLTSLKQRGWPVHALTNRSTDSEEQAYLLLQQLFDLKDQLPQHLPSLAPLYSPATLLSVLLRMHRLHFCALLPALAPPMPLKFSLEAPLTQSFQAVASKIGQQATPVIEIQLEEQGQRTSLSLAYDASTNNIKWPLLNGKYLARFQPLYCEIPYHIHLRQARTILYANETQPYSYESDILITKRYTNEQAEETLSMNRTYETKEGYRFYLSQLSSIDETAIKSVRIEVNYDPAKYWLTYPGGLILSLGILLLFYFKSK